MPGLTYRRPCPFCKSAARSDAAVCPSCGRDIPVVPGRWWPIVVSAVLIGVPLVLYLVTR